VNLYLRLLWTLLRGARMPAMPLDATLERRFRVLPNDLDINGHMNNGRYLTIVDLALLEFFIRTGFARVLLQNGWRPMSGGTIITYRRGLKPFEAFTVRFRWDGQDKYWNFMAFEFLGADGRLCAAGYMKGAAVSKSGLVETADAMKALGAEPLSRPLPDAVVHWLAGESALVAAARQNTP
jgi:acyl-CoA thioesterase FadM